MPEQPAYTPYDGSATPFTIGLNQLDPSRWIETDDQLGFYLNAKQEELSARYTEVFAAEPSTEDAQQEVLELLTDHLLTDHSATYRRVGNIMQFAGQSLKLDAVEVPALIRAGMMIADDLALMRRKDTGWHLSAAFVAFPSSWSLREKFGQPMEGVHEQVPGFQGGSRNADLINRMFDNLREDRVVTRLNWSIKGSGALPQPASKHVDNDPAVAGLQAMSNYIRVERQTLRRLPTSGDILFTIRVYVDPLSVIVADPRGAALLDNMAEQLLAMDADQLRYKGLTTIRDPLAAFLKNQALSLKATTA